MTEEEDNNHGEILEWVGQHLPSSLVSSPNNRIRNEEVADSIPQI